MKKCKLCRKDLKEAEVIEMLVDVGSDYCQLCSEKVVDILVDFGGGSAIPETSLLDKLLYKKGG